jgi:molecular chaperone GrpE
VKLSEELDAMRARAEAAEAALADTTTQWQRTAADFQNYRRRTEQEKAGLAGMASENLLRKVLNIADDFDRAIAHAPSDPAAAAWVEGVVAIDRKLRQLLESEGVTAIDAVGRTFDPRLHEAIMNEPTTEHPDGTVVKELQRGYEINGRVLRPALVAVADNTSTSPITTPGAGSAPHSED